MLPRRLALLLAVLLLIAGAARIGWMAGHQPLLGYANQFDMGRTSACFGLWPNLPEPARYQAHREARTSELEYRAVFEGSPVAVLKVAHGGEKGKILDANPAAERLFGYEGGLAGRHMRSILVDDERDGSAIRETVDKLETGPTNARATWDVRVKRGDGSSTRSPPR